MFTALSVLFLSAHFGFAPVAAKLPDWLTHAYDNGKGGVSLAFGLALICGCAVWGILMWQRESQMRDQHDGPSKR